MIRPLAIAIVLGTLAATGACATTAPHPSAQRPGVIRVVAAENTWGSLASQLGGSRADVSAIITNPNSDPHDYEPTAADATKIHAAQLVIINGVGYDPWAAKLAAANPAAHRIDLTVGDVVGVANGGNPHRWYDPDNVRTVIDQITADYQKLDPAHAAYFGARHDAVLNTDLKPYFDLIAQIKARYAGTPVGASESIFAPLAAATGLDLLTPPSFLNAISEGGEPTAADKLTIDQQIANKRIKVYVYNRQNATPDVQAQVVAARTAGIPVATITETLTPTGATFQDWQVGQLTALAAALQKAKG